MADLSLDLTTRSGLPEPLRVLLERFPREAWDSDPGFTELTRFWMDRHIGFRRLVARLQAEAENRLEDAIAPELYGRSLSRYGGMLVGDLHMHHTMEDTHFFPRLVHRDQRLSSGFDVLDADHHVLDQRLNGFVDTANTVLNAPPDRQRDGAGRVRESMVELAHLLDRHLTDEEELVVPIILKYGDVGLN